MNEHQHWIDKLPKVASLSHDPDTQTACILRPAYGTPIMTSNRIPAGVEVKSERLKRPDKYVWIQHAESQAVAVAAKNGVVTGGATCYLNWYPCNQCAALLIQAGIGLLVVNRQAHEARKDDPRYQFANAAAMLSEAGVEVEWF